MCIFSVNCMVIKQVFLKLKKCQELSIRRKALCPWWTMAVISMDLRLANEWEDESLALKWRTEKSHKIIFLNYSVKREFQSKVFVRRKKLFYIKKIILFF